LSQAGEGPRPVQAGYAAASDSNVSFESRPARAVQYRSVVQYKIQCGHLLSLAVQPVLG
jgi:hypothetical protein